MPRCAKSGRRIGTWLWNFIPITISETFEAEERFKMNPAGLSGASPRRRSPDIKANRGSLEWLREHPFFAFLKT
ncbi:MAG: hypothetical protein MZV70_74770 [Desulfobacterales bacterium]|nr:hypothetical protein [Desulfobacterales bacterium]